MDGSLFENYIPPYGVSGRRKTLQDRVLFAAARLPTTPGATALAAALRRQIGEEIARRSTAISRNAQAHGLYQRAFDASRLLLTQTNYAYNMRRWSQRHSIRLSESVIGVLSPVTKAGHLRRLGCWIALCC